MTLQQVIDKFRRYPRTMENGAGNLSKRWNCDRELIYKARAIVRGKEIEIPKNFPKILIFDIETSPSIAYSFPRWNANLYIDQIVEDPIMLTWAAKWLYSTEVMSDRLTVEEVKNFDDKRIATSLWHLIDSADIVVAHYGDKFDIPMMNTRAIINGLPPYSTVNSIDTKKVSSKQFKFPSNKLDAIASYFGLEGKIKTDFDWWKYCLQGSDDVREFHLNQMETYNVKDSKVLEEVYLELRPWIKAHPNVALYIDSDKMRCSNCGSDKVHKLDSFYYTTVNKYPEYRCECGALTRGRYSIYDKEKRKQLAVSVGK